MRALLGGLLTAVGILVLGNFVAAQVYDPQEVGLGILVWRILDISMIVGMLITVWFARERMRDLEEFVAGTATAVMENISARVVWNLSVPLLVLLIWNWLHIYVVINAKSLGELWLLLDVAIPMLFFATARYLWETD